MHALWRERKCIMVLLSKVKVTIVCGSNISMQSWHIRLHACTGLQMHSPGQGNITRLFGKHGYSSCAVGASERAQPAQSAPAQQAKPEPAPAAQQAEEDSAGPSEAPEEEAWVYLDPANREQVILLARPKDGLTGTRSCVQETYSIHSDMLNPLDNDKCHGICTPLRSKIIAPI